MIFRLCLLIFMPCLFSTRFNAHGSLEDHFLVIRLSWINKVIIIIIIIIIIIYYYYYYYYYISYRKVVKSLHVCFLQGKGLFSVRYYQKPPKYYYIKS